MPKGEGLTETHAAPGLLVVDDERTIRFSLGEWARDAGYRPLEAASGREALATLKAHAVDVVLLDLRLGEDDGLEVLKSLREEDPQLPVILLTGHGTVKQAVEAIRRGAYDFILKPPDLDHLAIVIRRARESARLLGEVEHRRAADQKSIQLVGESPGLQRVLEQLERAARSSSATILLTGETGSGKELMARHIHMRSPRRNGPFVDLNCSAVPEQLLESELFGYEKGAFTDARQSRKGLFDLADQGTLFLDEIGEMVYALQSKLLRVLETRTFRRVGGQAHVTVDVRVIAATHRDLAREVAEGRFRKDLFYRLNVVPVGMPPLRERVEDVGAIAAVFVQRFCAELARPIARLHPDALRAMEAYAWPGNVRELKNVVERVLLLEAEDEIRAEHLPPEITGRATEATAGGAMLDPFPPGVVRPLEEIERMAIDHALGVCQGNKTRAAQKLGISRQTLRTKLKEDAGPDEGEGETEEA